MDAKKEQPNATESQTTEQDSESERERGSVGNKETVAQNKEVMFLISNLLIIRTCGWGYYMRCGKRLFEKQIPVFPYSDYFHFRGGFFVSWRTSFALVHTNTHRQSQKQTHTHTYVRYIECLSVFVRYSGVHVMKFGILSY